MKSKLRIACALLLAAASMPALALQLGEIQVRSAFNQPLVAAIPLQPRNLTELDGLSVGLASAADFRRAGLQLTPTDRILRFRVITDNNGEKLILVTSSQPITDPYLDFLVQVNTRQGKQVREFVALLNPVIASPAPAVQEAPVAAPPAAASTTQPAELPAPSSFPQPTVAPPPVQSVQAPPQPEPQAQPVTPPAAPRPPSLPSPPHSVANTPAPPAGSTPSGQDIPVHRGDTLYRIARHATQGTDASINQMMLAMQAANPEAFFKDNIDNLKAGAILRIPTRDEIDSRSVAAAAAEVHRQYETWRAAKPHPATVVEGTAARAAAMAAAKSGGAATASDHLTLVPPTTGKAGANNSRPGVAGGTGTAVVNGLRQQLQTQSDTLISLNQSNSDLESRLHNLQDISTKTGKLLSLKDATIAELQHKLAAVGSGSAAASGSTTQAGASRARAAAKPASSATTARTKPVLKRVQSNSMPWYMQPVSWIIAGLVVLALFVLVAFALRRRRASGSSRGPLADPDDIAPPAPPEPAEHDPAGNGATADAAEETPHDQEVEQQEPVLDDPYGLAALRRPVSDEMEVAAPLPPSEPVLVATPPPKPSVPAPASTSAGDAEPVYSEDPVDTKLDLARAYLDMGDPVGARAMLEEVLGEGTQMQKEEARRLLGDIEE
jgi:pilus assembly protein FimV